jgi:hypothetical protein
MGQVAATPKPSSKKHRIGPICQSVSVRALAERGVREQDALDKLTTTYRRFLDERELVGKDEVGRDLIRAIFGKNSIAEDPIL